MVDRGRKDSLQLLRLKNDLNTVALAMRDMLDAGEPYPLVAWSAQFERVRGDLDSALRLEEQYAEVHRTPEQRAYWWKIMKPSNRPPDELQQSTTLCNDSCTFF